MTCTLVRKNESDESLDLDGITSVNVNRKSNFRSFFFSSPDDSCYANCTVGLYSRVWQTSNSIHSIAVRRGFILVWFFYYYYFWGVLWFYFLPFQPYRPSFFITAKRGSSSVLWVLSTGSTGVVAITLLLHYLFLIQVTRCQRRLTVKRAFPPQVYLREDIKASKWGVLSSGKAVGGSSR